MTGANSGEEPGAPSVRRWDVALSFAGAQRDYVGRVAKELKAWGVRCFYDADQQVRLWGTHLAEELPKIYAEESAAVVIFVSADYTVGGWTRLERRAAFSRAVKEAGVYVLPARFDDSELPGLLPDVGYVDLRHTEPEQFAAMILEKIADKLPPTDAGDPAQAARPTHPAGAMRAAGADPRQDQALERLAEEIQAARNERQRDARIQRRAQAKRVEVSRYIGHVPQTDDQVRAALRASDGINRTPSRSFPSDGRFLTIRISNDSDEPVYHVAISWVLGPRRREPLGESDPVGTLPPGKQVQRSRELPRLPDWMRSYERFYSAVVFFQDADGIRWRVMPDEPPEEVPPGQED